ncbi:PE family protein, partial [Mycobacterium szulgai]|uniref:PE family protein n=1 Tax=Mycobacterium szulgai TaxID=1787 RepID=UPI0021F3A119
MSYLFTQPQALMMAASDLAGIGSTINTATVAAAMPTTGVLAAGADEISAAMAAIFGAHGQRYQAMSEQAAALHSQIVQNLNAAGGAYASAEAANVSPLQALEQGINGSARAVLGRPLFGNGADGAPGTGQAGGDGGLLYGSGGRGGSGGLGQAGGKGGAAGMWGNGGAGGLGGSGAAGGNGGAGGWLRGNGGAGGTGGFNGGSGGNGGNAGLWGTGGAGGSGGGGVTGSNGVNALGNYTKSPLLDGSPGQPGAFNDPGGPGTDGCPELPTRRAATAVPEVRA